MNFFKKIEKSAFLQEIAHFCILKPKGACTSNLRPTDTYFRTGKYAAVSRKKQQSAANLVVLSVGRRLYVQAP